MTGQEPRLEPFCRHIFVCTGEKCASAEASAPLYQQLKTRLKTAALTGPARVMRSQTPCLGVCQGGPLAAVYPENVWYHHLNAEKMEQIIDQHLLRGQPVEAFRFYPAGPGIKKD